MLPELLNRRWPWIVMALLILGVFLSTFIEIRPTRDFDDRPTGETDDIRALRDRDDLNVLFILVDTMRSDRLGAYGYPRDTSPTLDSFANSGVRFGHHLSQSSWTKTSMASLWTGLYPVKNGIIGYDHVLPEEAMMPAEIFRDEGFRTAGIYRNGWVAPTFGFGQGFEVYQKSLGFGLPPGVQKRNPTVSDRSTDEAAVRAALEFLRLRKNDRWFLYLHLMDLHEYVYDPSTAQFGSTYSDTYDNSIRWTDDNLKILLDSMGEMGLLDKTLVVLTSDHGEAFGERGFEGHAQRVYRETTEVPMLIALPFKLESGIVVENRTRNIDVWPTVFDLLGIEMPQDRPSGEGRSRVEDILRAARGEEAPSDLDESGIAYLNQNWAKPGTPANPTIAVTDGSLRFVRIEYEGKFIEQLFDRETDPLELMNQATKRPEDLARLAKVADEYYAKEPSWAVESRELTELELGQLRALGYAIP